MRWRLQGGPESRRRTAVFLPFGPKPVFARCWQIVTNPPCDTRNRSSMIERSHADKPPRSCHIPVLVAEVVEWLGVRPGQRVVDGTVGGGGHASRILVELGSDGRLFGLDRDPTMLEMAAVVLDHPGCSLHRASYSELTAVLSEADQSQGSIDAIFLDLGLSSDQLADDRRGFGFDHDGPLDLRFDSSDGRAAWEWLATVEEGELEQCLRMWGDEPESRRIAGELVRRRREKPIRTGRDLSEAVVEAVGGRRGRRHPATRVFQALRIAVNDELVHLERALSDTLPASLTRGGRLVVISFHSLEDRIVKRAFGEQDTWTKLTHKPVRPTPREERVNPRSRSARLRVAMRA